MQSRELLSYLLTMVIGKGGSLWSEERGKGRKPTWWELSHAGNQYEFNLLSKIFSNDIHREIIKISVSWQRFCITIGTSAMMIISKDCSEQQQSVTVSHIVIDHNTNMGKSIIPVFCKNVEISLSASFFSLVDKFPYNYLVVQESKRTKPRFILYSYWSKSADFFWQLYIIFSI